MFRKTCPDCSLKRNFLVASCPQRLFVHPSKSGPQNRDECRVGYENISLHVSGHLGKYATVAANATKLIRNISVCHFKTENFDTVCPVSTHYCLKAFRHSYLY
ncbi:hypothetical protein CDAR_89681 [Caerostris darwini]|uniref:Uncharacterized protein n=1 Tax=Caerostris darwini TaxID=1538125 RepID=A0AAV4RLW0_9ARAC|nr:hypothetical protein CDAR_89681 [Caerostris darwini]